MERYVNEANRTRADEANNEPPKPAAMEEGQPADSPPPSEQEVASEPAPQTEVKPSPTDRFAPPPEIKPTKKPKEKKSGKKWLLGFLFIILVLAGMAGAYYFFMMNNGDETGDPAVSETVTVDEAAQVENPDFLQIIYAYSDEFDQPGAVYSRPISGGERTSLLDISALNDINYGSFGNNYVNPSEGYAFVRSGIELWYGTAQKQPLKIYTLGQANATISSPIVSKDGSKVAFSIVGQGGNDDTIWTIDNDGNNLAQITTESLGMTPTYWLGDDYLLVNRNILGSDGPLPLPKLVALSDGTVTDGLPFIVEPYELLAYRPSPDGNYIAYISQTVDRTRDNEEDIFLDFYVGGPYTVNIYNPETDERTEVAQINSTMHLNSLAWQSGTKMLYVEGSILQQYDLETNSVTPLYETSAENIDVLYAANTRTAIIGTLEEEDSYFVYSVDLEETDRTKIMETTLETYLLGILTE